MFAEVPPVAYEKLMDSDHGEDSAPVRRRVRAARDIQRNRFQGTSLTCNAEMGPAEVWEFCQVDEGAKELLQAAMNQLSLSARAFHRILKLSRTIADLSTGSRQGLAGAESINVAHLAEALQYRSRWVE